MGDGDRDAGRDGHAVLVAVDVSRGDPGLAALALLDSHGRAPTSSTRCTTAIAASCALAPRCDVRFAVRRFDAHLGDGATVTGAPRRGPRPAPCVMKVMHDW